MAARAGARKRRARRIPDVAAIGLVHPIPGPHHSGFRRAGVLWHWM